MNTQDGPFDPRRIYVPTDPELRPVAKVQTLARWRHEGTGPTYVKLGSRIGYRGADLNAWVAARLIRTNGGKAT